MILDCYHGGFDIERAIRVSQAQHIGELQGRGTGEKNLPRCTEFNDGTFTEIRRHGFATAARQLDWDPYRGSLGEKASQTGNGAVALDAAQRGCGLLGQSTNALP